MSEGEIRQTPAIPSPPAAGEKPPQETVPRRRLGWHWRLSRGFGVLLLILVCAVVGLYYWVSSAEFEDSVRLRVIAALEDATGGRVEVGSFHWDLLHLRVDARNITIHGLEGANEAPYAHVSRLRAQLAVLGLFSLGSPTRVLLREAEIEEPRFHLIVYADGTTNQPHPKKPPPARKAVMDTLFDAQIGRLAIERGELHVADRVVPLDLEAHDAQMQLSWVPDEKAEAEGTYRIQLSLGELAFAQGKVHPLASRLDASLMLLRDGVQVEELRLAALDRTLRVRGRLSNLAHPVWQAELGGQVDLRILAPYAGLLFTRSGVVDVNAHLDGRGASFTGSGNLASNAIHYQDPAVNVQTAGFSARFRMDPKELLVSDVRVKLAQGGEVDGEFQFDNWLDNTPSRSARELLRREHKSWPVPTGSVRATLNSVTLDAILDMLATPQFSRLGLDTVISGPATADWTSFADDLTIGGQLAMVPSANPVPGEAPVTGSTDAMYYAALGAVQVRTLDVHSPHSALKTAGSLGVFPVDRASEMDVDLKSSDLSEFDAVLTALDLRNGTRVGTAALPVRLQGQMEFQGQLNSSWVTPRVEGHLTATKIGIEVPSTASNDLSAGLRNMQWDSVDLDALYTPASITVRHGVLRRGVSSLTVQGKIDSSDPGYKLTDLQPEFDAHSELALKANAQQFAMGDLLTLAGVSAPVTGTVSAQVDVRGQLDSLTGSGSVDLARATVYGEAVAHVQATGSIQGQTVRLASLTAQQSAGPATSQGGGQLTATGLYDMAKGRFQVDARGSALDLGSIEALKQTGIAIGGKAGFTVTGDGTFADPHLNARATLSGMSVAGEALSDLQISAVTAQHAVTYELSSKQAAGEFEAHGVTEFNADATTQASLLFAKFDIGGLLKLLKAKGVTGRSDLEGTARVSGPLMHPEKLRGEASLNALAVNVEGVALASKGAIHATLVEGLIRLDPLEITGEDTDLQLVGSLAVTGKQQLDLKASGAVNLRLAETLDPDLKASGQTSFQMEAHGPLTAPILQGKVEFQNASLALQDFPNGLSQIKGTLEFIQNRLEVRSLTAMSGGGQLSVSGYLGFQHGLYADLTATGKAIRLRYPQGISSLADANLRLQGPQSNLLLSGTVEVNRFAINSDLDITAIASQAGGVQVIAPPDAPSNHLRLDVHLTSAPQLNFQNAYAKLAGDVDLRLGGTLASPSLLGRISLTEGSTSVGGTQYELQRGDINFNNPVRIQPNIDLDATARVEDYDITLGLHGTTDKLNVSYRSEPPLPEADVIALLALGRTQSEQSGYGQQQQQAGDNPMTDALLGGALNATVSNRVQRLFGTGAVKIDPNFIGSLGNSTARVTVVEQIGKNLTFTYASNVNTTTQQLIQAEIAINRHVSLLVTQDESGIFSVVVKTRRRYK